MNQTRSKVSDDATPPPPAARHHPKTPCENCPYRVDAPRRLWHRSEFERLLAYEGDQFGGLYNCHKHAVLPKDERGFCAGWLLDQRRRGIPSVRLRLALMQHPDAAAALEAVHAAGLVLFRTVRAMCRANGVRPRPERSR